ncbi:phage antirepressor KilAC domain-containing protein [Acetobacter orientalis]|uniref:phage antirepressor KilAC domain-containing protein n=1 Tax=Acetobacter orientalis TaxID=146474 RepID=UPI0039E8CA32
MTQNIIPFSFKGAEVRTVVMDGAPAFVGKDVCERLGYVNAADAMNKHCKGVAKRYPLQTSGGLQEVRVLSEPDVLRLIVRSKLPEAEEFERWVFEEVLPAIRKTGGYMTASPEETPEEIMLRALTIAKETVDRQKLELEVANERAKLQQAELESVKPKADALDRISIASGEYGLTETAKIIQIKPGKFFDWLDANRCRYARGKVKLAYQDKIDAGYFRNRATFYTDANGEQQAGNTIRVTPKGLAWLARVVPGAELDPAFKHAVEVAQPPFSQTPA